MSVSKNSSIASQNSGFIPGSEVNNNFVYLDTIVTKESPQDSKTTKSEVSKSKFNPKTKVTIGLNFDNGSIQTQYLNGSIKSLINQISDYKIPSSNKNYPVQISLSYDDDELRKLQTTYTPEPESADVLYFYFLKSVKNQLIDKPEQFMSTELAANILNIRHISLLDRLEKGEIPTSKYKNQKRVLSKDLFKLKSKMDQECSEALTELMLEDY